MFVLFTDVAVRQHSCAGGVGPASFDGDDREERGEGAQPGGVSGPVVTSYTGRLSH